MSVAEIPDETYRAIFEQEVKVGIDQGLWVDQARQRATEIMSHCFVARSHSMECEFQADRDGYIEEMGMTARQARNHK